VEITEFVVRLLVLFFPGIICFYLVDALTIHAERKPYEVFLLSFVYGVLTYIVCAAFHFVVGCAWNFASDEKGFRFDYPGSMSVAGFLANGDAKLDFLEIGWVTLAAVFVAFALSWIINRKWLFDVAQKLRVTKKFGDPNVWSLLMNSDDVEWATVRDMERNLMFTGQIGYFSDVDEVAEILMYRVVVYDETTAAKLYEADRIYLSRKRDNLIIELPNTLLQDGKEEV
jgi:hypothetical protein